MKKQTEARLEDGIIDHLTNQVVVDCRQGEAKERYNTEKALGIQVGHPSGLRPVRDFLCKLPSVTPVLWRRTGLPAYKPLASHDAPEQNNPEDRKEEACI